METALSLRDDALHTMAMDDLAELVPPGEEDRVPERLRGEVLARHAAKEHGTRYNQKYELTPEREAAIRARYDGRTSTIRAIAGDIGVPWYTVRDWAQGRLGLRNPTEAQPNGLGSLAKRGKPQKTTDAPAHATSDDAKPRHGPLPWATERTDEETSEIEAARAKRAALLETVTADTPVRSDTNPLEQGWLTPKWTYTDAIGAALGVQWDGSEASLAELAERNRMPLGVLRSWIDEHHVTPKAAPASPRPLPPVTPLVPLPPRQATEEPAPRAVGTAGIGSADGLQALTAWLDRGEVDAAISVFAVPSSEVLVLRGLGGYRVLTPQGDWPDEPISRKLVERIVRLLASGASEASVYGVVYQAEGAGA